MRLPWITRRLEAAERRAAAAERGVVEAEEERRRVQRIAAESREIKRMNGFTEAIRTAMGVQQ